MNWLRYFKLLVQTDSRTNAALDLSEYRVTFEITQANMGQPCTADIRIYNVSPETVRRIKAPTNEAIKNETYKVVIDAGYRENHAVIFNGELWWKSTGRDNETETYMRLIASMGDRQTAVGFVNQSFTAGSTQANMLDAFTAAYGENVTNTPSLLPNKLIRGKAIYKPLRGAITQLATNNGLDWGLTTDGLTFRPSTPTLATGGTAVRLNSLTGMIGRPTMTVSGVRVRCLLNPRIQYGTRIKIDNASIQRSAYDTSYGVDAVRGNISRTNLQTDADGLYEVFSRVIVGDTRGQDWYCDLIALGVNSEVATISKQPWQNIPNAQ